MRAACAVTRKPLLGLAPDGVCPARLVTKTAVRSYRTFSPLPVAWRFVFCGTFHGRYPPGVTWHLCPWSPDFPLKKLQQLLS